MCYKETFPVLRAKSNQFWCKCFVLLPLKVKLHWSCRHCPDWQTSPPTVNIIINQFKLWTFSVERFLVFFHSVTQFKTMMLLWVFFLFMRKLFMSDSVLTAVHIDSVHHRELVSLIHWLNHFHGKSWIFFLVILQTARIRSVTLPRK